MVANFQHPRNAAALISDFPAMIVPIKMAGSVLILYRPGFVMLMHVDAVSLDVDIT